MRWACASPNPRLTSSFGHSSLLDQYQPVSQLRFAALPFTAHINAAARRRYKATVGGMLALMGGLVQCWKEGPVWVGISPSSLIAVYYMKQATFKGQCTSYHFLSIFTARRVCIAWIMPSQDVRLFVRLSVRQTLVFCLNGYNILNVFQPPF